MAVGNNTERRQVGTTAEGSVEAPCALPMAANPPHFLSGMATLWNAVWSSGACWGPYRRLCSKARSRASQQQEEENERERVGGKQGQGGNRPQ